MGGFGGELFSGSPRIHQPCGFVDVDFAAGELTEHLLARWRGAVTVEPEPAEQGVEAHPCGGVADLEMTCQVLGVAA
jgi:hypothetical protein